MEVILNSKLYRSLAGGRHDIELWEANRPENGWTLFSIVSRRGSDATILAELRLEDDQLQQWVVGDQGNQQWLAAE